MIKWYFIKLLPVFIWILSQQHLHAANGVAVDAVNEDDTQSPWKPTAHQVLPTADLSQLYESKDDDLEKSSNTQRRFDDELPAEADGDWKPALITAEDQPTAGFVVSATQTFSEDDTMPAIDRRNDWKSIETDVQSPVLEVQSQFNADQVTGKVSDRPHYEPWVQRERFVSSTSAPVTTTQRFNKSYRKPYVGSRRNEEQKSNEAHTTDDGKTANLRSILKQTGGLSLSEILQQQNLSLEDLLKGKQNAIQALKNTAAPPPPDGGAKDGELAKSTRRLPSLPQLNVMKPRRNFFNGTTRVTNADRVESSSSTPMPQTPDEKNASSESSSVERKIFSTIPTYLPNAPSKYDGESGGWRIPPSGRGKVIKEVVSGIRPDLDNSNLRKRMPNMKFLQSKFRTTSTVETLPPEASKANETQGGENKPSEEKEEQKIVDTIEVVSSTTEAEPEAVSVSTTTGAPRMNLRERLALRPPRIRNVPSLLPSTVSPTEPSSSSQAPVEVTSTKVTTTSEESLPYTIVTFNTQSNDQKTTEPNEVLDEDQPKNDDLNKKLNESVPELNLVDLEDESKSKEVTSLEELFISDSMDPDSNSNSAEMDEFIHASSTSRSDSIFKSEKPNSLKIFGGNLVNIIRKTIDKLDVTERNPGLFTDITSRYVDDKTELMDLLNDRRSGARLVKVLRQRNMTVDELLEHRKRGSSQVHLAEIFHSRSKVSSTTSPTPPTQQQQQQQQHQHQQSKLDVVTAFKNFPDFNLDSVKSVAPDEIKTDSQGSSYFTSITNIQPTAEVIKESRAIRKPFVIQLAESATGRNIPTQLWNNDHIDASSPHSEHNFLENSSPAASLFLSKQHILRPSTGDEMNVNTAFHDVVDQNRNDAAARSHDPLDLELSGHGYKRNNVLIENAQIPIGVRSAIVASASIVLISMTIFFIIFMVCRWRQRRKRKICYSDRFQALRGRLPILGSRDVSPSKRSTSPAIAYLSAANSSRRSSKLNTMDPNSPEVQDYLYDAMRKPFQ
ncbi:uncharacterized protein LOC129573091 [Sitodiplosis mosellana]|uniref:uncharacterized protein LOC129573091 n=1 Tax=Sitodiplosis mosellana TaxID=263140 RepID=UPI00244444DE|nr:uncharacterized protein LOC129573091 [Sitodiplosis mosellana]